MENYAHRLASLKRSHWRELGEEWEGFVPIKVQKSPLLCVQSYTRWA